MIYTDNTIYRVCYWNKRNNRSKRDFKKLEKALEFAVKIKEQAAFENRPIGTIIWKYRKSDIGKIEDMEIILK